MPASALERRANAFVVARRPPNAGFHAPGVIVELAPANESANQTMSHTSTTLKPAPHVSVSRHPAGAVLFDVASGLLLGANLTGALIWSQLQSGRTPAETLDTVCREFDIDREIAEPEVMRFIASLADSRLLVPGDPS